MTPIHRRAVLDAHALALLKSSEYAHVEIRAIIRDMDDEDEVTVPDPSAEQFVRAPGNIPIRQAARLEIECGQAEGPLGRATSGDMGAPPSTTSVENVNRSGSGCVPAKMPNPCEVSADSSTTPSGLSNVAPTGQTWTHGELWQ